MTPLGLSSRLIAKNTMSQVAAYVLSWGTKGAAMVAVARFLGPAGLGVFSVGWTVASMLSVFALLGIERRLIRELSRGRDGDLATSLPPACLLGLVFGAGTALLPALLGFDPELVRTLAAAGAFIAVSAPVQVLRSAFVATERMEVDTLVQGIEGLVALGSLVVVLLGGGEVAGAMIALAVGRLANLGASGVLHRRMRGPVGLALTTRGWPRVLRESFPMGAAYLFSTLTLRVDILLLAAMRPAREVGLYSAAALIVSTLPVVVHSLNTSLYPALSRAAGLSDAELRRLFATAWRILVVTSFAGAAVVAVLARPTIDLLYGPGFATAGAVLAFLVWGLPGRVLHSFCGTVYNATDLQGRWAKVVGAGAVANIAGNLVLIPVMGIWGAVTSTLLTETLLAVLAVRGLRPLRVTLRPMMEGLGAAVVVGGLVAVVPGHIGLRAIAGVLGFGVLAWLDRRLRGRRRPSRRTDALDLVFPGGSHLRLDPGDPDTPVARYVAETLGPVAGSNAVSPPDIRIRTGPVPPPGGDRLSHLPLAPHGDTLWVGDHVGHGALLPLGEIWERPVTVDPRIDPWFFGRWVYLPLLRAALWRSGTCLVRAAGVELDGRRIAIAGWERSGKTSALLRLLDRGAALLGDDWIALAPDGTAGPVTAQIALRDDHRGLVRPGRWPGPGVSVRRSATSALRWTASRTAPLPMVSMGIARLAESSWKAGTKKVGLHELLPGHPMASPGPLDAVLLIVRDGADAPAPGDLPALLAAQGEVELGHCLDLQAAFRYVAPGRLPRPLFPAADQERTTFERALARTQVRVVAEGGDAAEIVRAVAAAPPPPALLVQRPLGLSEVSAG